MSLGTANRDGGKTSESGHLRALTKGFRGQVLSGLNVSQRGAGANMSVDIAIGDAIIPRSDGTYSHPAYNDAVLNQAIATADPSNPRRDIVVMYIDYTQTPSTGVSNNTNGVVKVKVVAGTPAGSPVDPTASAIQSSVGSGNPYIQLARVRVGAGVTSVGNSVIDDLRIMGSSHVQGGWLYEYQYTWVYVSATSFKIAGVDARAQFPLGTKIQLYQGSVVKYFVVTATAFSTDTTITVDGKGTYSLTNDIIDHPAYSYLINPQGFAFPGVQAINIDLNALYLGSVSTTSFYSNNTSAATAIPGMSLAVNIPNGGRKTKLTLFAPGIYTTGATGDIDLSVWDGPVGTGTRLFDVHSSGLPLSNPNTATGVFVISPAAGAKTYNVGIQMNGGAGGTYNVQVGLTLLVEAL